MVRCEMRIVLCKDEFGGVGDYVSAVAGKGWWAVVGSIDCAEWYVLRVPQQRHRFRLFERLYGS